MFFGEVKDKIEEFKTSFEQRVQSKDERNKEFELQKMMNEFEYKSS